MMRVSNMENYIWLMNKKNDFSLTWPFVASLVLHFLLFTILVIKPIYPLTADTERLDSIWLYFNQQPSGQSAPQEQSVQETAAADSRANQSVPRNKITEIQNKEQEEAPPLSREQSPEKINEQPRMVTKADKQPEPVTELVVAKEVRKRIEAPKEEPPAKAKPLAVKTVVTQRVKSVEKAKPVEDSDLKDTPAETERKEKPEPEVKQVRQVVENKAVENKLLNTSSAGREIKPVHEKAEIKTVKAEQFPKTEATGVEPAKTPAGEESKGIPGLKSAQQVSHNNGPAVKQAETSSPISEQGPTAVQEKKSVLPAAGLQKPAQKKSPAGSTVKRFAGERKAVSRKGNNGPLSARSNKKAAGHDGNKKTASLVEPPGNGSKSNVMTQNPSDEKQPPTPDEAKGIVIPHLTGDLKVVVAGTKDVKITFAFKEYPKSRRYRPISKSEASRVQTIAPRFLSPKENLIEAVVETAGEGIYDIVVEPMNGSQVSGAYLIKVYENSGKGKTRSLGTKTVKEKTVIARILMPEGIFWDDDTSFNGYLEDSDSIIKYNSGSGLVWKEYKSPGD